MNRSSLGTALIVFAAAVGCSSDTSGPPWVDEKPNLVIVDGDGQSAAPATAVTRALVVQASSPTGTPLPGWVVTWSATGGGRIAGSPTTDASGKAQAQWTLGSSGTQEAQASISYRSANGLVPVSAKFSASISAPVGKPKPAILHYDGTAWTVVYQPTVVGTVSLVSIWGSSPSSIFAVGGYCGVEAQVKYDGTSWSPAAPDGPPGCTGISGGVHNVSGSSGSNVFEIRAGGGPLTIGNTVAHFDGTTWTFPYGHFCTQSPTCDPALNAIWTDSPTNAFVVGNAGFIAHYNGSSWDSVGSGTTNKLRAVWGVTAAGTSRVFAAGDAGTILSYDGTSWHTQSSGTTQIVRAIWGTSASDVFAAGDGGVILHYDGVTWSTQNSSGRALYGIWGSGPTSVFAVGDGPTILFYDGSTWTPTAVSIPIDLRAIWGTSANDIYAVGQAQ